MAANSYVRWIDLDAKPKFLKHWKVSGNSELAVFVACDDGLRCW